MVTLLVMETGQEKPRKLRTKIGVVAPDTSVLLDTSTILDMSQHDVVNFIRMEKSASPSSSFIQGSRHENEAYMFAESNLQGNMLGGLAHGHNEFIEEHNSFGGSFVVADGFDQLDSSTIDMNQANGSFIATKEVYDGEEVPAEQLSFEIGKPAASEIGA